MLKCIAIDDEPIALNIIESYCQQHGEIQLETFTSPQEGMNRIKEILERKGVSQTDLAHRLGKTFNMVNLYATNKVQPPIPILYKIAEILDVDIRELLVSNKIDTQ